MNMTIDRTKVLYVDDEQGNLLAFRATFRREFDLRLFSSATEALESMENDPPHVVISDQRMPGMSGSEFLEAVRERWPRVIRILLTGYSDIEAVVDAVNKGGIHAYITKPWDPTDLRLRIQQAYEVHLLRSERERLFQRYRQVFEASGDPIVIVEDTGRLVELNPAAEKVLEIRNSERDKLRFTDLIGNARTLVRDMRNKRKGRTFPNVEVTVTTPGGRALDCLLTATWLGRSPGDTDLFQAVFKDITDRKQEEERLRRMNTELDRRVAARTRQLKEALDDLNAFSYSVAHDLRSPLKSMRSFTEHLRTMAVLQADPELRMVTDRIHHSATKLQDLVDDLLRFARTDQHNLERSAVDVGQLVRELLKDMATDGRQVELSAPAEGTAILFADRAMLGVALGNLLSNALKFTRERPLARISVELGQAEGDTVITVSDNGIGFDPEKAGELFGVFKRLHRAEQYEGTGIGLAMVQRIAQKHGGDCWAESRPGEGAAFHLRLPAAVNHQSLLKAV